MDIYSSVSSDLINVAVGIIFNSLEEVLITKRSNTSSCASLWEFPGGKVEHNETPKAALIRELKEEVDIECKAVRFWLTHESKHVRLHVFFVTEFEGKAQCLESQQGLQWLPVSALASLDFPKTNYFLIDELAKIS